MSRWTVAGRQDVMRILRDIPEIPPTLAAQLCGMAGETLKERDTSALQPPTKVRPGPKPPPPPPPRERLTSSSDVTFLRVAESRPVEVESVPGPVIDLDHLESLSEKDFDALPVSPPRHPELLPWPRLWPFLRRALGGRREANRLDTRRLLADLAALRPVTRLPRLRYPAWPGSLRVHFDWRPDLSVFWDDMRALLRRLQAVHAHRQVRLSWKPEDRRRPIREDAVLVLGDMGLYLRDATGMQEWCDFGSRLKRAGVRHAALVPVPQDLWEVRLTSAWRMACWDRVESPPRSGAGQSMRPRHTPNPHQVDPRAKTRDTVIALLSPFARIEPGLLRSLRLGTALTGGDVGTEYDAWNDRRMSDGVSARMVQSGYAQALIRRLAGSTDPMEIEARPFLRELSLRWNRGVARVIRALETIHLDRAGVLIPPDELDEAREIRRRALATYYQLARRDRRVEAARLGFFVWQGREHERADLADVDRADPTLSAAFAIHRHWSEVEGGAYPPELDEELILGTLRQLIHPPDTDTNWEVRWRGSQIVLRMVSPRSPLEMEEGMLTGSPLGFIRARWPLFALGVHAAGKPSEPRILGREGVRELVAHVSAEQRLSITSDRDAVVLERSPMPEWATQMGQDRFGGFVEFEVRGVRLRLRWIPPGTFLMGSPESEKGRFRNEGPQHWVTITRGYWMAETPCTQALWEAVMGNNPSSFKGLELPVESVNWNQCRDFCERMTREVPGLVFRLPTEAEWEYACRAGTATAFNDGSGCTGPDGNDPALERLGWFNKNSGNTTHPVPGKDPNAWGLYDMHGNVWEWCADGRREYRPEAMKNPTGFTVETAARVLRGGSYGNRAKGCRSACRSESDPGLRSRIFGFRLAADQVPVHGEGSLVGDSTIGDQCKLEITCLKPTLEERGLGSDVSHDAGCSFRICWEVMSAGEAVVGGTIVEMSIPPGLTFRSATEEGQEANGQVLWNLGSLAPGASRRVCATLIGSSGWDYSLRALARGERADPVEAIGAVGMQVLGAILVEAVNDATSLQIGEEVTYTIRVTNRGGAGPLDKVIVKAVFPAEIGPTEASHGGVISGDTVTWAAVPSLLPKQTLTYTAKGKGLKTGVAQMRIDVTTTDSNVLSS